MPSRKMLVTWEDGTELSASRLTPGEYSPLTREGGNLVGHVTLSDLNGDTPDVQYQSDSNPEASPTTEAIAALAILAIAVATVTAAPHLKRWWQDAAVPLGKRLRRRLSRHTPPPLADATDLDVVTVVLPTAQLGSPSVDAALVEYCQATISRAEARDRLVAAMVARMFADHQLRILRDSRISDGDPTAPMTHAVETLTPEQISASLQSILMLEQSSPHVATLTQLFARLSNAPPELSALPSSSEPPLHNKD
jgi:hypothetical protein